MRMLAEISIQKASARPISASDSTDVPILAGNHFCTEGFEHSQTLLLSRFDQDYF